MPVQSLTYDQFRDEVCARLDGSLAKADVQRVLAAFSEEVRSCLANGYKVTIPGLVRFEPQLVAEKKRGELVRDPRTGGMIKREKNAPAKFRVKAYASTAIARSMPTLRSKHGQALRDLLVS